MDENKIQQAQEMSFLELINDYVILIPVIQRDYAQGRISDDVNKIREDFVHDLLNFIKESDKSHNIDFIYGTVKQSDNQTKTFIPLDGQQRLTTLFLLHLYLAGISNNYNSFKEKVKDRFEYATRKSSTEFCRRIVSHNIIADLLSMRGSNRETKLSDVIENQGWFFSTWKQDPTVQGLLVMLDEIDKQIKQEQVNVLYSNLFEKRPIVFQWQPLEGYTLTDDLYIKMNARGLRLTDFEVFKALYELSLNGVDSTKKECFTTNIDGKWCDFFWQKQKDMGSTDIVMERILRLMIALGYARQIKSKDQNTLDKLFYRNSQKLPFAYSEYRKLGVFHDTHLKDANIKEDIKTQENDIAQCIIETFNTICNNENSPLNNTCCTPWCDEQELLKKILTSDFKELTYDDFVYFYAFISFSARYHGKNKEEELKSWMRYVYNLTNATSINDSTELAGIIRSIDKIIESIDDKDVLLWIVENKPIDAFSKNQRYEEVIKANLILWGNDNNKPEWKDIIEKNEQDKYMRGQIGFLLVIADVYTLKAEKFSDDALQKFKDCSQKARKLFEYFVDKNDLMKQHLLERALLTKKMYLKSASAGRLNFCNRPSDRDYSWRKMLEISSDSPFTNGVEAMKDLLCDKWDDNNDPIKSLNNIINTFLSTGNNSYWYIPFIEEGGIQLLDICHQGFIHKQNNTITLLHESQMNHYHSELQSKLLFHELKSKYSFIQYCPVRSSEEHPGIYFRIKISEIVATIYIYYQDNWYLEVWDEHMYNYLRENSHEWNSSQNEFCKILSNTSYDGNIIQINKENIETILINSKNYIITNDNI